MASEAAEKPVADSPIEMKADEKPAKKTKVPKEKKAPAPRTTATHPPYLEMIIEAITALKERTGSSQPAIAKYLDGKYKTGLPPNFKKQLSLQLKKLVEKEKLVQIKHSFKIAEGAKKPVVVKKPAHALKKPKSPKPKTVKSKPKSVVKAKSVKPKVAVKPKAVEKKSAVKKAPAPKKSKPPSPKKAHASKKAKAPAPKKAKDSKPKSPAPKKTRVSA